MYAAGDKRAEEDGRVVRVKTDDRSLEDSWERPQMRGCLRGQARARYVYGDQRLKYPMKRKHWEVGGGQKELRGRDEWVRISWDEALDIVASEFKRIRDTYGNASIIELTHCGVPAFLTHPSFGGCLSGYADISYGAWMYSGLYMCGMSGDGVLGGAHMINDRIDLVDNTQLIVLWGNNPAWSTQGLPNHILQEAKHRGARILAVDPFCNGSVSTLADEWVPIRPGTDTAMLIACAYVMITNNLQDQEFLDTYCSGFDAEHMPEGADPRDNFKDYVLGTYDGVPKTPEWASEFCGVAPETITAFAREIATTKPAAFFASGGPARQERGEQFCQAFLTVGWMTGNVGKPGAMVGEAFLVLMANGGHRLATFGSTGAPSYANTICANPRNSKCSPSETAIPCGPGHSYVWDAVLNDEYINGRDENGNNIMQPCNIQMLVDLRYDDVLNQEPGAMKGIQAYRKVEFAVSSDVSFSPCAQYSDVVLPVSSNWEQYNLFPVASNNSRDALTYTSGIIDPLYEAKSDEWIYAQIAERLGIKSEEVVLDEPTMWYNQIKGSKTFAADGKTQIPLFTITQSDLDEIGVKGEVQQGVMNYQDFKREGMYQVTRKSGDNFGYIAFKDFIDDPEGHPLNTETGKFEIYCPALSRCVEGFGSDYSLPPIPEYIAPEHGYEATFSDFKNKKKGKYPLQVVSVHAVQTNHSTLAEVDWLQQARPISLFMNPLDAEDRGIKHGDAIKLYNDYGAVVRPVTVTPRVAPGVVLFPQGGWLDYDEETGIDFGATGNTLLDTSNCGTGIQPFNSIVAQAEKYDGELTPDSRRARKAPVFTEGE